MVSWRSFLESRNRVMAACARFVLPMRISNRTSDTHLSLTAQLHHPTPNGCHLNFLPAQTATNTHMTNTKNSMNQHHMPF
jgi:hypothetical protein